MSLVKTSSKRCISEYLKQVSSLWHLGLVYFADKMRKYHDDAVLQQVAREKIERAAVQTQLTQHWATHQRVEDSRDADLRCSLKGAVGFSVLDARPLGPASMQVFQVTRAGRWFTMHHM